MEGEGGGRKREGRKREGRGEIGGGGGGGREREGGMERGEGEGERGERGGRERGGRRERREEGERGGKEKGEREGGREVVRHTHISSGWNLWINAHMAMPSLQEPERSLTRIPYRSTWFLAHFRRTAGLARDILSGRERKRGGREENGHTCFNDNVHTQYM